MSIDNLKIIASGKGFKQEVRVDVSAMDEAEVKDLANNIVTKLLEEIKGLPEGEE
jgi:hypothetical protein